MQKDESENTLTATVDEVGGKRPSLRQDVFVCKKCGGQRTTSGANFFGLETGSLTGLEVTKWARLAGQLIQASFFLCLLGARSAYHQPGFSCTFWRSNSGPQSCKASTLAVDPAPWPLSVISFSCLCHHHDASC